jgi:pimeloyl-ACP methyl ester carboxylesterase
MPTDYWLVAGIVQPVHPSCLLFRVHNSLKQFLCFMFTTPAGHSLGGGVAALVTLLLQQPCACHLCGVSACTGVNLEPTMGYNMSFCAVVTAAGHSLGGGVAALVTLLLQQPGALRWLVGLVVAGFVQRVHPSCLLRTEVFPGSSFPRVKFSQGEQYKL